MSDQNPFDQVPSGAPIDPIGKPSGRPWKPFAAGIGAALVVGVGVFGVIQAVDGDSEQLTMTESTSGDDGTADPAPEATPVETPEASVVPENVGPDASVPSGTLPDLGSLSDLSDLSIPEFDQESFEQLGECLGIDLSEIPLDLGTLKGGSVPEFDLGSLPISIPGLGALEDLDDLEDLEDLDLEALLEELLESVPGSIPGYGDFTIPEFTMPDIELPEGSLVLPFDPAQLQECFADLELDQ